VASSPFIVRHNFKNHCLKLFAMNRERLSYFIKARLFTRNAAILTICTLLAALFVYTGFNKLLDHELVKSQFGRSPFIQSMAGFLSVAIPTVELIIAGLLCIPPVRFNYSPLGFLALPHARLLGLYLSFGLMFLFTCYVYIMLAFSYDLPCSCGGVLAAMSWQTHLYFNSCFTLLAAIGVLLYPKPEAAVPILAKPISTA
jgi:hypothetical protein